MQSQLVFAASSADAASARPSMAHGTGRNRWVPRCGAAGSIVALLAVMVVSAATVWAAGGEGAGAGNQTPAAAVVKEGEGSGGSYDHFLYVRHNLVGNRAETTALVLAKVTPEGFQQRDIIAQRNLATRWEPIDVVGGKFYAVTLDGLIAIDLATGGGTMISSYVVSHVYDSGRLYGIVRAGALGVVLRVFDLRAQTYRDVSGVDRAAADGPPVALSPDRKRVAFFTSLIDQREPSVFRLSVVDLEHGTVKTLGPRVESMVFTAGGGAMTTGPTFVWLDAKTILLVRDEPGAGGGMGAAAGPQPATRRGMTGGIPSEPLLATLDVETEQLTDVLRLPQFNRRFGEPYLRPLGSDSVPRIVVGELGQYRIDLKTKKLVEDDTLVGEVGWVRGRRPERLVAGQTELFRGDSIPEISVSPDGRSVAWVTSTRANQGELRYHDLKGDSTRVVAKGWFPTQSAGGNRRPEESAILWAKTEDLERAAPAEPPKPPTEWRPFPADPWPASRPPRAGSGERGTAP